MTRLPEPQRPLSGFPLTRWRNIDTGGRSRRKGNAAWPKLGEPDPCDGEIAEVIAHARGGRAKPPVVVIRSEKRQILTGEVVGRIDAVRTTPRDDLTTGADFQFPDAYGHVGLTQFGSQPI